MGICLSTFPIGGQLDLGLATGWTDHALLQLWRNCVDLPLILTSETRSWPERARIRISARQCICICSCCICICICNHKCAWWTGAIVLLSLPISNTVFISARWAPDGRQYSLPLSSADEGVCGEGGEADVTMQISWLTFLEALQASPISCPSIANKNVNKRPMKLPTTNQVESY